MSTFYFNVPFTKGKYSGNVNVWENNTEERFYAEAIILDKNDMLAPWYVQRMAEAFGVSCAWEESGSRDAEEMAACYRRLDRLYMESEYENMNV